MPVIRDAVFAAIERERLRQDAKRGFAHPVGSWLTVLRCELREAEEAWAKRHPDDLAAIEEILQVAAVAVACLEQHGKPGELP